MGDEGNNSQSPGVATSEDTMNVKKGIKWHRRESLEQIKRISRVSNFSEDEVIAVWGDSDEFRLRKKELKRAVIEMQQGRRSSDNLTFTAKGLEDKTSKGREVKKQNRALAWRAVFDELDHQELQGLKDDELLADVYHMSAHPANQKAREDALAMEAEVQELLRTGNGSLSTINEGSKTNA